MRAKLLILFVTLSAIGYAQDTVLNRSVVVERDFQPIISEAGKVNSTPQSVQADVPEAQVEYSDYVSAASRKPLARMTGAVRLGQTAILGKKN